MQEREKKKEKISWFADVACCRKEGEERNVLPPSKLVIRTSQNGKKSVRRKKLQLPAKHLFLCSMATERGEKEYCFRKINVVGRE